ncbi:30S ribosomal protein S12 methylthiotransferase RimO [Thermohalobacter berrensis]|uniref:Ribosomal protein uS12 methylthiotransferase RimO n=1 Tax=Thermohalobacter berrensis TaxID=99594 RepID=A0A419TAJ9_9FIRM|nr:30S ribosomal protein S12 methylthiotransferase RimO [Thermohalobacter berrensis]RKD34493.1 ribosomal protein S12 methylthiotransferase RimO [Thermohalobacter berrensis]
MDKNVAIISLGCSKNLVDSEIIMGILNKNGYTLTNDASEANIIVVNTCGFIDSAKEESIDTIIEVGEYKKNGKCKFLIVCGCLGERYKDELIKEMPEIDAVIGTGNITEIIKVINELSNQKKIIKVGQTNYLPNENEPRIISTQKPTAYVKIAEGCDNFCTYCIIPKLRGRYRSRKIESIEKEVKELARQGIKEIILIAQDTTRYGIDIYDEYRLPELLDRLNKIEEIEWIRVLYMYPDAFTDELIESIRENEKVVNYVDIPIQHINNNILKRMNRRATKEDILKLINKLRDNIPNIIIRTTLIVGFPGETEEDFNELYDFIKDKEFDRLGVFTYSKEEGTPAAKFKDQIEESIKKERQNKIMEIQRKISYEKNLQKLDKQYKVLLEEKIEDDNVYVGRTYMDVPEIDGVVYVHSDKDLELGTFINVKIVDALEYDLIGEIIDEFSQ